jgi:hypothetical protein
MSVAQALLWRAVLSRSANGAFGMCRPWRTDNYIWLPLGCFEPES